MNRLNFVLFFIVLCLTVTAFKCGNPLNGIPTHIEYASRHNGKVLVDRTVLQKTPKGAVHYSNRELSASELSEIDAGIDELNASAIEDGFLEVKPHSFYVVDTPPYPCQPSPVQRIPSFVVGGGTYYDGSDFDQFNIDGKLKTPFTDANGLRQVWKKDGRSVIFAAEMVLSIGTIDSTLKYGEMYVCILRNGTRHGGEHIYLANYPYTDQFRKVGPFDVWAYFNASLYHGDLNHPLLARAGRLPNAAPEFTSKAASLLAENLGEEKPPDEVYKALGIEPNDKLVVRYGLITRPVK